MKKEDLLHTPTEGQPITIGGSTESALSLMAVVAFLLWCVWRILP